MRPIGDLGDQSRAAATQVLGNYAPIRRGLAGHKKRWPAPPCEDRSLTVAARNEATFRAAAVRSCKDLAEIAGLTDESVCPTLVHKGLCFVGQAPPPANRGLRYCASRLCNAFDRNSPASCFSLACESPSMYSM